MNWIDKPENKDAMSDYMSKLARDLAKSAGHDFDTLTAEDSQVLGLELTEAWMDGKSQNEQVEYLVEKYGTELEKKSYKEWLQERA